MGNFVELQSMVNDFERMIDMRRQGIIFIAYDFRPVWEKAREIQAIFNNGVRFPTFQIRQTAWEHFRNLRDEASRVFKEQQEQIQDNSEECRNEILSQAESAEYRSIEDTMFFFDRTTVEGMKVKARQLKGAFEILSRYKDQMLGEHKQECHKRLCEVKETHDQWWMQFKGTISERHSDRRERIQANLEKNREKLEAAAERLEKIRENVENNRSKLKETTCEKWIDIFTQWIEDGETDVEKTEAWIDTLHEWIKEGEDQLAAL